MQPKIVVVMGDDALATPERPRPSRSPARWRPSPASCSPSRPACEALVVPNIDEALDEEAAKRAFWSAFRVLGEWYAELPPY